MNPDPLADFPLAPAWSLWVGTAGKALVFAGLVFFLLSTLGMFLARRREGLERFARVGFILGCVAVFGTMACLITLFVKDQFHYEYVFGHAARDTELKYKVAGVWSGQQGSFLLWACCSAFFGLLALRGTGGYLRPFVGVFSAFLAGLCGILAYETPFSLMKEVVAHGQIVLPPNGVGLVPALQNYWVVIHPPTIFLGFGSLTVLFAYSIAAMATGNVTDWIRHIRPWCLVAVAVLGIGICMGGFWAYETLGWGGFWKWDPVENASLVPWLFVVALAHGIIVQVSKGRWVGTNLILGALPFLTFVYGTFLTRSGFLTEVSVHSFAEMDRSALQVLVGLLAVSFLGFMAMYVVRGRKLAKATEPTADDTSAGLRREGFYRWGVLMVSLIAIGLAVGMSWPFFLGLAGRKAAIVEEGLYHQVVVWFFAPLMFLMAVAPFVSWRGMGGRALLMRVINVFSLSFGLLGASLFLFKNPAWGAPVQTEEHIPMPFGLQVAVLPWVLFLFFLCLFVAVANLWRVAEIWKRSKPSVGGFVSHVGIAVLFAGLILSRGFERKAEIIVREDRPERALDYVIQFKGLTDPTLRSRDGKAEFDVIGRDGSFRARPGLYYTAEQNGEEQPMVWPHVERMPWHDVYFALGEPQTNVLEAPITLKVGETRKLPEYGLTVTYLGLVREGEAGVAGTSFGARLKVTDRDHDHEVTPKITLGQGPDLPLVNEDFRVMLAGMDAATKSVNLQLYWATPLYPVQIYYKPMTSLVWLGTGIMTLGGLIAAVARRRRKAPVAETVDPSEPAEDATPSTGFGTNAPVPTA